MNEYTKIIEQLEYNFPHYPHKIMEVAHNIFRIKSKISLNDFTTLSNLFINQLINSSNQDILSSFIEYAINIIDFSDMLYYEEMVKIYSICEDCYILKELGIPVNFELDHFYYSLNDVKSKNSKTFNDIEVRFRSDYLNNFDWNDTFL